MEKLKPTEYVNEVIKELDARGFGKMVSYYKPPQENMAQFMSDICKAGWDHDLTPAKAASIIEECFGWIVTQIEGETVTH